ncbi:hypothetical protein DFH11DRAFT_1590823 [Phellopilus nigrolimitatus]|nr:hypothetical protein DFH11DRAFT_1590823 [Phellopilus nigrolimitatus]
MRARRRRAHLKRQGDSLVFQPGADLLLNSVVQDEPQSQGGSATSTILLQSGESIINLPASVTSGVLNTATSGGRLQTQLLSSSNSWPQASSTEASTRTDVAFSISEILFAPSSLQPIAFESTSVSPSPLSLSSSEPSTKSSDTAPAPTQTATTSAATSNSSTGTPQSSTASAASRSTSQSSTSVIPTPQNDAVGHSAEFYVGIVFISIVVVACILSFAAWILRSRRHRPSWCGGGGNEDEDMENQDLGFGLGLYLEKPVDEAGSARTVPQSNPFVLPPFTGFASSPQRNPTAVVRPPAAQLRPTDTAESPTQLLGRLQVNNYMEGDFSSSSDEATRPAPAPSRLLVDSESFLEELGTPREAYPGLKPRFLGVEGRGLSMPWAPLNVNVKAARAPSKVDIAQLHSSRSVTAQTEGEDEDEIMPLPMPHFRSTPPHVQAGENESSGGVDGWSATLRSSLFSALSGLTGGTTASVKPPEDNFTTFPPSRSRSNNRWRGALSSHNDSNGGREMVPSDSHVSSMCDVWTSPKTIDSGLPFTQPGSNLGMPVALGLVDGKIDDCSRVMSLNSTTPLVLTKRGTKSRLGNESNLRNQKTGDSRTSSIYIPCPRVSEKLAHRPARLGTRASKISRMSSSKLYSKRRSALSQSSLARPAFLKRITGGSATSFSSEASETTRGLTDEEALAKQVMLLRARRKRGLGTGIPMGRKLTTTVRHRNSLDRQSSTSLRPGTSSTSRSDLTSLVAHGEA